MSDALFFAVDLGPLLLFPALALWALRSGGVRRLQILTTATVALAASFALVVAPRFGLGVAPAASWMERAAPSFILFGTTLTVPMLAVSGVVASFEGRRVPVPLLYGLGVVTAGIGWFAGAIAVGWIMNAYLRHPL